MRSTKAPYPQHRPTRRRSDALAKLALALCVVLAQIGGVAHQLTHVATGGAWGSGNRLDGSATQQGTPQVPGGRHDGAPGSETCALCLAYAQIGSAPPVTPVAVAANTLLPSLVSAPELVRLSRLAGSLLRNRGPPRYSTEAHAA